MGFRCGIVGLPNVGKSTLFNALTATAQAAAENYPFCTIEPNIARVPVPDRRLGRLAAISHSARVVPTQIEFVDIAGLVRGASRGEGLGNRFLANIREVDAIAHVVRCFEDPGIAHVEGAIDPVRDVEIVETELLLADLESLERRLEAVRKRASGRDREAEAQLPLIERLVAGLREARPARALAPPRGSEEARLFLNFHLLTAKPVLYVLNVDEASAATGNPWSERMTAWARARGAEVVVIAAKIEAELAAMDDPEARDAYLNALGLEAPGLERLIAAGYRLLGLITFFTTGPKETHAWTVPEGATALEAAAVIHSDFARGFIRVEVIPYDDFVALGGEAGARAAGKLRVEGRDFRVRDGDVLHFRFNV